MGMNGGGMGNMGRMGGMNGSGGVYDGDDYLGPNARPGDWRCYKCGNVNFKFRDQCNKCEAKRPGPEGQRGKRQGEAKDGDWDCPRCGNPCESGDEVCEAVLDGEPCMLKKPDFEGYGVPPVIKMNKLPGDWSCYRYFRHSEAFLKEFVPPVEKFRSEHLLRSRLRTATGIAQGV